MRAVYNIRIHEYKTGNRVADDVTIRPSCILDDEEIVLRPDGQKWTYEIRKQTK